MEYFLVYKTIHSPTSRFYVGRHATKDLEDNYLGSGIVISNVLKAHPRSEFIRENLHLAANAEEMIQFEQALIKTSFNDPLCLNLIIGDPRTIGVLKHSEKTKKKISDSTKGKPSHTLGKKFSIETKRKMSLSHTDKPHPSKGGWHHSKESKNKISKAHLGEGNPRYGKPGTMLGKTHSIEARKKVSLVHKGIPWTEARRQAQLNRSRDG